MKKGIKPLKFKFEYYTRNNGYSVHFLDNKHNFLFGVWHTDINLFSTFNNIKFAIEQEFDLQNVVSFQANTLEEVNNIIYERY